jgi:predicted Zn-dependent protease
VVPTSTTTAVAVRETTPAAPRVVTYEDAEAVFQAGNYSEAKALFTVYVESKPENPWGHYMLGLSSWKSGDLTGAERAFDLAIKRDPKHVKSLINSARVLLDLGRGAEALERINTARTLDSTSSEVLRLLARAQYAKGDVPSAVKTYQQVLVTDERDVWAMNNLGALFIEQNDAQSALAPLARAVQLKPTSPVFQNNLGMALELTGHLAEARVAYDNAVKADSSFGKAVRNAKRLGEMTIDPTAPGLDVKEFAELFRQYVRMWRDSIPTTPDL